MKRKRILHKLKIDEISGVDCPAQEGATVAIMKRHKETDMRELTELEDSVLVLTDKVDVLTKAMTTGARSPRDNSAPSANDFETLVQDEMRKGLTYEIAAQRVLLKHGARPDASAVAKSRNAQANFMAKVHAIRDRDRCDQTSAMTTARHEFPALFKAYQEA